MPQVSAQYDIVEKSYANFSLSISQLPVANNHVMTLQDITSCYEDCYQNSKDTQF